MYRFGALSFIPSRRVDLWGCRMKPLFQLDQLVQTERRGKGERDSGDPLFVQIWLMSAHTTFLPSSPGPDLLWPGFTCTIRASGYPDPSPLFSIACPAPLTPGQNPKGLGGYVRFIAWTVPLSIFSYCNVCCSLLNFIFHANFYGNDRALILI